MYGDIAKCTTCNHSRYRSLVMVVFRIDPKPVVALDEELVRYINLKLAVLGQPTSRSTTKPKTLEFAAPLLRNFYLKETWLGGRLCPVDARAQTFLDEYLYNRRPQGAPRLPWDSLVPDRVGMARTMSLPPTADELSSPHVRSYRVSQGILHNPKSDRRTTKGLFHIVAGSFPVPSDKVTVPKTAFAALLEKALNPPADVMSLPFTADQEEQAHLFVSLLLRPVVCPATGSDPAKSMEIRFFAPASLVSNLDFTECIFGNGGDPYLPENDAALDVMHWTGHTGCVILAPHLTGVKKRDLGLPKFDDATELERRDGMCWRDEDEPYNGGSAFKIACRDHRGVMVTIIADNYFGYCKKEVKTQISYSANLYGLCEEEHAGGAIAAAAYVLGQEFCATRLSSIPQTPFEDALSLLGNRVERMREGFAVDRQFPDIVYVPGDAEFSIRAGTLKWTDGTGIHQLPLSPERTYVLPSGYRVRLNKRPGDSAWQLLGSVAEGTLCHKPCTVSGGGKSEDFQVHCQLPPQGPGVRPQLSRGLGAGCRHPPKGFLGCSQSTEAGRPRQVAHSEFRAVAGIGHQAPHPIAGIHRSTQRVAAGATPNGTPACLHREELLPPRIRGELERPLLRGSYQRLPWPRAEIQQPKIDRQLPPGGL